MRKGIILSIAVLFILASGVLIFAQPAGQTGQPGQSGPGYGRGWWMMGQTPYPHPHMMGPGMMGPWMMGPGMGPGWGMGPGMMGPGMMGPGWGGQYQQPMTPEEAEAQAKAFVEEYIRLYLPGYELKKKTTE